MDGAAFDFHHVDVAPGERLQCVMERAGFVRELKDERDFVGGGKFLGSFCRRREQEETRVIFAVVFQMLLQNHGAVKLRGALAGDGRARGVADAHDFAHAPRCIFGGNTLQSRMFDEELFALG